MRRVSLIQDLRLGVISENCGDSPIDWNINMQVLSDTSLFTWPKHQSSRNFISNGEEIFARFIPGIVIIFAPTWWVGHSWPLIWGKWVGVFFCLADHLITKLFQFQRHLEEFVMIIQVGNKIIWMFQNFQLRHLLRNFRDIWSDSWNFDRNLLDRNRLFSFLFLDLLRRG